MRDNNKRLQDIERKLNWLSDEKRKEAEKEILIILAERLLASAQQ